MEVGWMCDVNKLTIDIIGIMHQFADLINILPQIVAGGEIEAKPEIDIEPLLLYSLVFLAGMGIISGFLLAFTAKKFAVKIDPRVEPVHDLLAHAYCGACGYAGCEQYAEAVVKDPEISPRLCTSAGERAAQLIAGLTGKRTKISAKQQARVICGGGLSRAARKYRYEGVPDCRAAVITGGGDKACVYGCLGYGTCGRVCQFDAIEMSQDYLPVINPDKCTACGKCVAACPRQVIELIQAEKPVFVACHSRDKAADTQKQCSAGCIACGICVNICPFDAPKIDINLCRINPEKCRACGLCVPKCPTGAIADRIIRSNALISAACTGCGICLQVCPVDAISCDLKSRHAVDAEKCVGCGLCVVKCPAQAIKGTYISGKTGKTRKKPKKVS
jgi:Na+-translocating ferredoxin:NAD+ oxidoreductase RNF subunit RnfB